MKIGFVGLGNMGLPMAINLSKAGYEVYGKNRSRGREEEFAARGGIIGRSLAELARHMDMIITCLPLPSDVKEVYSGREGLLKSARPGLMLIDCSTVSPELNRELAEEAKEAGTHFLDAPVSGGTTGARAGTLSIMVGGEEVVYQSAEPVLKAMGQHLYYVGPSGSGSAVKLINQLMVAIHTQAVSEAFALGRSAGLDAGLLFTILNNSFAQSRIMERHYSQFISQDQYVPGFASKLLAKDMNLAVEMASRSGVGLSAGSRVQAVLNWALAGGGIGELDMAGMYTHQLAQDQRRRDSGAVRHFAVFLPMLDQDKSAEFRELHLRFLDERRAEGKLHANGRFADGAGGLVIYRASSYEEVESWVKQDPYIIHGARTYEIHEWDIVLADG